MILVLTSANDRTADRVVAEIQRRGRAVSRFDLADFPRSVSVTAQLGDGLDWCGSMTTEGGPISLADLQAVYYRRPTRFVFPGEISESDLAFATAEARRGLGGLLLAVPCRWVNNPSNVADAEFKPFQLAAAAACGLAVPRTLLTNDPDQARDFCSTLRRGAVYKPLSAANIVTGDEVALVFTSRVSVSDLADGDVSLTMNLFQEWIPKRFDARVTVFGDQVFGVAIHAGSPDAHLDWRIDYPSLSYETIAVPPVVADAVLAYLRRLGLLYGAFDFAVTDDQWYFLECNANGQYGWLEAETGLPMTAALVDLLTGERV